jgi:hypothetical protein
MPSQKRPKPLYQRGRYALYPRDDRANLEIVWYDETRKRERSQSAGSSDIGKARLALDRLYLADTGHRLCPTCNRPWDHEGSPLLLTAINDYLIQSEAKAGYKSAKNRLGHVIQYLLATDESAVCATIDARWIDGFREWMSANPMEGGKARSLSHIEGCVMQLAAAINATPGEAAQFKAEQQKAVSNSPTYRADVPTLAAMFNYCLNPEGRTEKERAYLRESRTSLLDYLRMAVATWARPDAIFEVKENQWHSGPRVLDLNPVGRRQTKKHRPKVPIPRQFAPILDEMRGKWLDISVLNQPWTKMRRKLGLPDGGQAGTKLIRRSMATLARARIGEANWRQGEMMLGHVKASISDIYAFPDPANLGLALAATESIIDEIEKLAPGAYYRMFTASGVGLTVVDGGKSG